MKLTNKELEVMIALWYYKRPMTASELIEYSTNRTWHDNSIYTILNILMEKGALVLTDYKPTTTKSARAYAPTMTAEEYAVRNIKGMMKIGVEIDIPKLVERLKSAHLEDW
ncbi:MAG: BlaI/MecI/CopY family transcriptional regulator [Defluviitaleaceae bacterium]|nr:BlaI/MecI/CopY family transcriptional regulator [Defluviitaleaceae bacterium]